MAAGLKLVHRQGQNQGRKPSFVSLQRSGVHGYDLGRVTLTLEDWGVMWSIGFKACIVVRKLKFCLLFFHR